MKLARFAGAAIALLLGLGAATTAHLSARDEVRALWVVRTSLTSPQAIDAMVVAAQQSGFNTLLVQVRGQGDAYFLNGLEPRPASLLSQPAFDPLADTIAKAHARGLAVHAWINVNLVSGTNVPSDRTHIVYRHPEWLMVPRQISDDLAALDPAGPEYLGRLTRYARTHTEEVEGLYLSPATPGAVEYTASVVRDIVQRYAVDGVHFDYLRYPNDDFDYSHETLNAFRRSTGADQTSSDRWRQFRVERLTALLTELRSVVKHARPAAEVSVDVAPDPVVASDRHLQDWSAWLNQGLLDVVCRQVQTGDKAPTAPRAGVGGVILSVSQLGKAAFSAQF